MDCRALLFFAASARDQSPLWRSSTAASSILAGVRFGPSPLDAQNPIKMVAGLASHDGFRWRIVSNINCGVGRRTCVPTVLIRSIYLLPMSISLLTDHGGNSYQAVASSLASNARFGSRNGHC